MQAFILGAGLGTRLAPLTHILPKPLMPVFQKPLIQHTMDHYIRCGIRDFWVNISCLPLMWERAFPEGEYRGCPVRFSEEAVPLDSGGGVKKILPLLEHSEEPLLVHNGDILADIPVQEMLELHRRQGNMVTLALRSVDGKRNVGYDAASGRVTDIRHALGVDAGEYQFAGVYLMETAVAELFPPEELFSMVPVWLELVRQGKVGGYVCDWAQWHEVGSPESYLETVLELSSRERVHPTARIHPAAELGEDCTVGQDAVVPEGCVLDDCIVWPRTHVAPGYYRRCIVTPRIVVQV
ncbi:MAG: NTP transferase domain-containing protein [Akkermansia sp.]|nr:NTP transferase domain-containing protein [Akkermansia sp.]